MMDAIRNIECRKCRYWDMETGICKNIISPNSFNETGKNDKCNCLSNLPTIREVNRDE